MLLIHLLIQEKHISDIDECATAICNSTTSTGCIDLIEDYLCDCVAGWTGKTCEISKNSAVFLDAVYNCKQLSI